MADVDTSIYSKLAPVVSDPLATASKAIGILGAQQGLQQGNLAIQQGTLNNQLLGLQVQGKQAIGQIIGKNTDPKTGETDWNGVAAAASQDPNAAILLPDIQKQVLDRKLTQTQLARENLGLNNDQWKLVGNAVLPLINQFSTPDPKTGQTPKITPQDVTSAITQNIMGSEASTDPKFMGRVVSFVQNLPDDPQKIMGAIKNLGLMSDPTPERTAMLYGPTQSTDTGPGVAVTQTPVLGGPTQTRAVIDKGLSPSEVNTPAYTTTDANNVQHIVLKGAAAAAPPGTAPTSIASGVGLGVPERATQGTQFEQGLNSAAAKYAPTRAALQNFRTDLANFEPGPKADLTKTMGALAAEFGVASPGQVAGVKAQETAGKTAQQILQLQFQSLGGTGTNQQMDSVMHTSPNELMSKEGGRAVTALLLGNNDALRAQHEAYQTWIQSHGPQDYGDFIKQWNQHFDPKAFQFAYMQPGDQKDMLASMSQAEKAKFNAFTSFIKQRGWYNGGQ